MGRNSSGNGYSKDGVRIRAKKVMANMENPMWMSFGQR